MLCYNLYKFNTEGSPIYVVYTPFAQFHVDANGNLEPIAIPILRNEDFLEKATHFEMMIATGISKDRLVKLLEQKEQIKLAQKWYETLLEQQLGSEKGVNRLVDASQRR